MNFSLESFHQVGSTKGAKVGKEISQHRIVDWNHKTASKNSGHNKRLSLSTLDIIGETSKSYDVRKRASFDINKVRPLIWDGKRRRSESVFDQYGQELCCHSQMVKKKSSKTHKKQRNQSEMFLKKDLVENDLNLPFNTISQKNKKKHKQKDPKSKTKKKKGSFSFCKLQICLKSQKNKQNINQTNDLVRKSFERLKRNIKKQLILKPCEKNKKLAKHSGKCQRSKSKKKSKSNVSKRKSKSKSKASQRNSRGSSHCLADHFHSASNIPLRLSHKQRPKRQKKVNPQPQPYERFFLIRKEQSNLSTDRQHQFDVKKYQPEGSRVIEQQSELRCLELNQPVQNTNQASTVKAQRCHRSHIERCPKSNPKQAVHRYSHSSQSSTICRSLFNDGRQKEKHLKRHSVDVSTKIKTKPKVGKKRHSKVELHSSCIDLQNPISKETQFISNSSAHLFSGESQQIESPKKQHPKRLEEFDKHEISLPHKGRPKYLFETEQQSNESMNLREIRRYENEPHQQVQKSFAFSPPQEHRVKIFTRKFKYRQKILQELRNDYPLLTFQELEFLSSIYFIQRKWREKKLSQEIQGILFLKEKVKSFSQSNFGFRRVSPPLNNKQRVSESNIKVEQAIQTTKSNNPSELTISNLQFCKNKPQNISQPTKVPYVADINNENNNQLPQEKIKTSVSEEEQPKRSSVQKPVEEAKLEQKAGILKEEDVFPQMSYLKVKKQFERQKLKQKVDELKNLRLREIISPAQHLEMVDKIKKDYRHAVRNIKLARKSIKKGLLRYVESFNQVKLEFAGKESSSTLLKRTNSQESLMNSVYGKIFNLESLSSLETVSDDNSETGRLIQSVLIRKPRGQIQRILADTNSTELFRGCQSIINAAQTEKGPDLRCNISHLLNKETARAPQSEPQSFEIAQRVISKELSNQRYFTIDSDDLYNSEEEDDIPLPKQPLDNGSSLGLKPFQYEKAEMGDRQIGFNEVMPPQARVQVLSHRKEKVELRSFLNGLIQSLLSEEKYILSIQSNLNKAQGFKAEEYLRFIREFELPEDCYSSIIDNDIFMSWQQRYLNELFSSAQSQIKKGDSEFSVAERKLLKSVEYRCLFEQFNGELEKHRIYGEKGVPFPWETANSCPLISSRHLNKKQIPQILRECAQKVYSEIEQFNCGIIEEKHSEVVCEEQFEELHERNEDEIIEMLEWELHHQKEAWNEFGEHNLEIKLELSAWLQQYLFEEAVLSLHSHSDS